MAITPFMNLNLPTVSVTLGPEWANQLNTALSAVDAHDHSSGKGTQIKTAGININADLNFNSFRAFGLLSAKFNEQLATLTGSSNALSLFAYNGNLYWVSGAGTPVQLTAGASIIPTPAAVETMDYSVVSTDIVINPASSQVVLAVDTTAARQITLPSAAAVAAGRIYIIKDATGNSETNTITILPDGADVIDGALSSTLTSNWGSWYLITNGIDRWLIL